VFSKTEGKKIVVVLIGRILHHGGEAYGCSCKPSFEEEKDWQGLQLLGDDWQAPFQITLPTPSLVPCCGKWHRFH